MTFAYDSAGNTRFESATSGGNTVNQRASYYGSDDRLLAVDRRSTGKRLLEEYRYDALGRRVWVSTNTTCAPNSTFDCVTAAVQRTI